MKTTVELNDSLIARAKDLAERRNQTFKSVLETALRQFLDANDEPHPPFKLRKHSFGGQGLQSPFSQDQWSDIIDQIYQGRGG